MESQYVNIVAKVSFPQWRNFLSTWKNNGIRAEFRKFNEDVDQYFVRQRIVAVWDVDKTMLRGVSERDNPSTFLA
jgi:hypothetical protein